jgi:uncharacterized protein YcbK (DUF882 family)
MNLNSANAMDALLFRIDSTNPKQRLSRNFQLREFASKCGSHQVLIHPMLLVGLQAIRDEYGAPISITSAYRTPNHNNSVGGAPNSLHTLGMAADVTGDDIDSIASIASELGLTVRIYPEKNFVHLDVGKPRNW